MFTILIKQKSDCQFEGQVREVPIMASLRADNPETLISHLKKEIHYLLKDREDLQGVAITVEQDF